MFMAYALTQTLTAPIIRLSKAAQRFGRGDFKEHLEPTSNDEVGRLTVSFNDMAGRLGRTYHQLEDEVEERNVQLSHEVALNRQKDEFLSFATHQLKTPPTAIRWSTDLLLGGELGKLTNEQKETIKDIRDVGTEMRQTVDLFLNVSRVELGSFKIESKLMDPRTIVESALSELKARVGSKNLKVIRHDETRVGQTMLDESLAHIIFQNLISNAVKYSPQGGQIRISLLAKADGGFIFEVQDDGIGIPKAQQARIFERMFRAENVDKIEGTGFGLYLVKKICDIAGLTISFESKENVGSTFRIAFPREGMKNKEGSSTLTRTLQV
jgi:signal transduction histidine kinase